MSNENKRCLILGGAGFIGLNVALYLKKVKDMKVTVLDSLSNSYIKCAQSSEIFDDNDIQFLHANALDIEFMKVCLKDFDYVINLISPNIIDDGFTRQEDLVDASILTTQILIQAASQYDVSRIIIASNLHVYGETKPYRSKGKENMKALKPWNPLGSIKLSEETIAATLARAYEQKVTILRLGECFGPYMKTHMPFSSFVTTALACLTGKECTIPNDGLDGRDYIYIDDVCEYIGRILEKDQKEMVETYNVCNSEEKTFKELFDFMKQHYGREESKIQERMVLYPFVGHIVGDNSKINKKFGKHYSNFDESMKTTLDWLSEQFTWQQDMINQSQELVQESNPS